MRTWQLQTAKNRFSEVVDRALKEGPQKITRRGVETAVVLSADEYRKLTTPKENLCDFLMRSPLRGLRLDLERNKDLPRKIDL